VGSKLGPLGTSPTYWPIVSALGNCEDGEFGGMNGRGNRSTRRTPASVPLCPPQIPHDLTWARSGTVAVGSRRLTTWAMARPQGSACFTFSSNLKREVMRCSEIPVDSYQTTWRYIPEYMLFIVTAVRTPSSTTVARNISTPAAFDLVAG
jgi:hypothetical protein